MTVVDLADATEISQAVEAVADHHGPVYLRLKRGEIPRIFDDSHRFSLTRAQVLMRGADVCIVASGMMVPAALAAGEALADCGVSATVINAPVIKPLDSRTIVESARRASVVVTAENHSVIGGLGSAVAEALSEAAVGVPLRRVGVRDVFAESGSREYLFEKYHLGVKDIIEAAWAQVGEGRARPQVREIQSLPGTYAPV
jgi:transketolase